MVTIGLKARNVSAAQTSASVVTASSSAVENVGMRGNGEGVDGNSAQVLWRFESDNKKLVSGHDDQFGTAAIREHAVQVYLSTTFQ